MSDVPSHTTILATPQGLCDVRLTLAILGWEFDLSLAPSDATIAAPDGASLDGGTTASTNVLYFGRHDVPADLPWVERDNGWGDEEE